jgi:hypothetical protein
MSNGNARSKQPARVLVGGACGGLKGNRHIVAQKDRPTANLLVALGDLANAKVESIGASTGRSHSSSAAMGVVLEAGL